MKRVLLYILLMMTGLFFTACDAFFLPPFERTNPYDSEAPVAPVASFQATPTGPNTVELSWTLPEDRAPSLLLIVRNDNAQPTNPDDGTVITSDSGSLVPAADGLYTDTQEVEQDATYYYGVWSAHGDVDADIDDYVFIGPVYDSASTVLQTKVIYPTLDGYEDSGGGDDYSDTVLRISGFTGPIYYNTLMLFDLSSFQSSIQNSIFEINCMAVGSPPDTLSLEPIENEWDISIVYNDTIVAGFTDTSYNYQISISGSGLYSIDITTLVNDWIAKHDNYGLLLYGDNDVFTTATEFTSSEGALKPSLTIQYYE